MKTFEERNGPPLFPRAVRNRTGYNEQVIVDRGGRRSAGPDQSGCGGSAAAGAGRSSWLNAGSSVKSGMGMNSLRPRSRPTGPSNRQARLEDELIDRADAVGRAEPDVRALTPGLEVLVDVAGQADDPPLVRRPEGMRAAGTRACRAAARRRGPGGWRRRAVGVGAHGLAGRAGSGSPSRPRPATIALSDRDPE